MNPDFKPAWWLPTAHLQTLWPAFFKKRHALDYHEEELHLDDGDFIDLCWSKKPSSKVVVIVHGLEGSLDSHYANGIFYQLEKAGFKPVFMYFRGCSGRVNRLARAYHSGDTGDLNAVIEHIKNTQGEYPYGVVGYSLGGNVLLKWLGETGENNPLMKAIAISVPFRLHDAAQRLEQGLSKIYREHLLQSMRESYRKKFLKIQSPLSVDVNRLKSFWDYDDQVTAPLHGFDGAQDYYDRCSSRQFLKSIAKPTLIIHSADDPFMFKTTPPQNEELAGKVRLLLSKQGGHVGFVSGNSPLSAYSWSEKKIIEFLQD